MTIEFSNYSPKIPKSITFGLKFHSFYFCTKLWNKTSSMGLTSNMTIFFQNSSPKQPFYLLYSFFLTTSFYWFYMKCWVYLMSRRKWYWWYKIFANFDSFMRTKYSHSSWINPNFTIMRDCTYFIGTARGIFKTQLSIYDGDVRLGI